MVPVAPIVTGITFVFTFHMRCISIVRSLYFIIFSASFLITFLSPEIATLLLLLLLMMMIMMMTALSVFSVRYGIEFYTLFRRILVFRRIID